MPELPEVETIKRDLEKVIVGKTEVVKLLIVGILTNGHILIDDVPGMGKTMLSLALAKSIHADFKRIQFTPDLFAFGRYRRVYLQPENRGVRF